MHPRILHLLPDLRTDNINLLLRVAQNAREESVGERFEAFRDLEVVPGAHFFLRYPISTKQRHLVIQLLITRCLSAGQVPTGKTCLSAVTPSKPASFSQPSRSGPGQGSMPLFREAARKSSLKCLEACSRVTESSGDLHSKSRSMYSTHPPGLVCLVNILIRQLGFTFCSCFRADASRIENLYCTWWREVSFGKWAIK